VIDRPCRALVVACNFPPDASVGTMRTLRLVRHLTASAWQVSVLTVAPEAFRPGAVVDAALVDRVPPDVAVVRATPLRPFARLAAVLKRSRTPASPRATGTGAAGTSTAAPLPPASAWMQVRRAVGAAMAIPDRDASWLVPAIWGGWKHAADHRPDVVYSSGPPFSAHLVAAALARLLRVPWVADFRDPWARAPWREDRFAFERKAWAVLERFVIRRADAVVFVTDTNRRDFAREYGSAAARFSVVPNGCDLRDFDGLSRRLAPGGNRFVMLHAGSLYGARNPAPLFRALASAIAKGRIDAAAFRLRFIGRVGAIGVDLPALALTLGLEGVVEFASHMPRRDSLQEMLDASALLIVQPITTVSIPAKLYEYMAAGKPILALAEPGGETADLIARSGAGVAAAADSDAAIEDALVSVVRLAREGFAPVDRREFDGDVRAAELRTVLACAVDGTSVGAEGAERSPTAGAPR
jgi:glycosyltransferase involved in cell wall biosynthesis